MLYYTIIQYNNCILDYNTIYYDIIYYVTLYTIYYILYTIYDILSTIYYTSLARCRPAHLEHAWDPQARQGLPPAAHEVDQPC